LTQYRPGDKFVIDGGVVCVGGNMMRASWLIAIFALGCVRQSGQTSNVRKPDVNVDKTNDDPLRNVEVRVSQTDPRTLIVTRHFWSDEKDCEDLVKEISEVGYLFRPDCVRDCMVSAYMVFRKPITFDLRLMNMTDVNGDEAVDIVSFGFYFMPRYTRGESGVQELFAKADRILAELKKALAIEEVRKRWH
jgi:hypothetical protein